MEFGKLESFLKKEPKFRLKQAQEAIFKQLIDNWQKVSSLPKNLQDKLVKDFPLDIKAKLFTSENKDTTKSLFTLDDGKKIESVLMQHIDGRNTICLSSQVGCPLGCIFCATGKLGFTRNLTKDEIITQALFWQRFLYKTNKRITNVVFMGMGEPFLNWENVSGAIKILNDKDYFNIGARHISVSTAGVPRGIDQLADFPLQINLAVSLHAPNDILRSKLMPINKKYPLEQVLKAVSDYVSKTKRKVMFEYLLIKNINDSDQLAYNLAKTMKHYLYMVNLIPYNPTAIFQPSSPLIIKRFKQILENKGINVTQRFSFGQDINAACGQLAGN